jgi:hypothetical protein
MCWHLSVSVPAKAAARLHQLLPADVPARPETDSRAIAAAHGDECFCLGVQCACGLNRKRASASERLRRRAEREGWSESKVRRALQNICDDWSGLRPDVRHVLATVAEDCGRISILLFWAGRGGRSSVPEERIIGPNEFRCDPRGLAENQILAVVAGVRQAGLSP